MGSIESVRVVSDPKLDFGCACCKPLNFLYCLRENNGTCAA